MFSDDKELTTLPRGRHTLSRDEVERAQRDRILQATIEVASGEGYGQLTVSGITKRARVARGAFYREFSNKDEAFFAAGVEAGNSLLRNLYAVGSSYPDWVEGLRAGTDAMVDWLQKYPEAAPVLFIEMPAAGAEGHARRDRVLDDFTQLLTAVAARARQEEPNLGEIPEWVPALAVTAVVEAVATEIRHGNLLDLHELSGRLLYLQLALLSDSDHAAQSL